MESDDSSLFQQSRSPLPTDFGWNQRYGGIAPPPFGVSSPHFQVTWPIYSKTTGLGPSVLSRPEPEPDAAPQLQPGPSPTGSGAKRAILLVDSLRLSRESIASKLVKCCQGLELVTTGSVVNEKLIMDDIGPTIAILNMHGYGLSSPDVATQVEHLSMRSTPLIVVFDRITAVDIEEADRRGLCGLFPSHGGVRLLAATVQLVLAGGRFRPQVTQNPSGGLRDQESGAGGETVQPGIVVKDSEAASHATSAHDLESAASFTSRECEIIECLRRGMQNKNIAFDLGISESTVKSHLRLIMHKLKAGNRTEVVSLLYGGGPGPTEKARHSQFL